MNRPADRVLYRGDAPAVGGGLVTVTRGGQEHLLRHVIRHSPTGLSWGYAGSGPADLALSVLTDALGERARCAARAGRGRVA